MIMEELIAKAIDAREKAYTPYSHFKVGVCLKAKNGETFQGCNIENSSYPATNCAERTAIFKAVSEGITDFSCIVIVGGRQDEKPDFCSRQKQRTGTGAHHAAIALDQGFLRGSVSRPGQKAYFLVRHGLEIRVS